MGEVGTVNVEFTKGVGNVLFQYIFAKLMAHIHGLNLSHSGIPQLQIPASSFSFNKNLKVLKVGLNSNIDYHTLLDPNRKKSNYNLAGFFEDYTLYAPHLDLIKSWFTDVPKLNSKDLVFHLRLGDRLVYNNSYEKGMKVEASEFIEAFKHFDYERLHIVTDLKEWDYMTPKAISKMKFHNVVPQHRKIDPKISSNYLNSLVEEFKPLNPIVRAGCKISHDFDFMRSFDKILFQHGTFAWWAATLSKASQVGVYGPWRPAKKTSNKNLGQTNYKGWFQWGNHIPDL